MSPSAPQDLPPVVEDVGVGRLSARSSETASLTARPVVALTGARGARRDVCPPGRASRIYFKIAEVILKADIN